MEEDIPLPLYKYFSLSFYHTALLFVVQHVSKQVQGLRCWWASGRPCWWRLLNWTEI